jgi:hypothetical protein
MDSKGEVWKTFIVMVPTLAAAVVAGTRIMDARHHPFDVLSGSAMGLVVAWLSYRQYFPPISETWRKGRAYPIRSWGRSPEPPRSIPTIQIDEDVEPLRPMRRPTDDLEQGNTSGYSSQTAVGGASGEASGNIFRQQISQSQRRRQEEGQGYAMPHTDTMGSTMSAKVSRYQNQMPAQNPYAGNQSRHDTYDYSSSEEESNYELQPTYTASDTPHNPVYNPVSGSLTDTGYHRSAGMSPTPTPPPQGNAGGPRPFPTTGDIGDSRTQTGPAVPSHGPGTSS